jgi:hypothetical protein
VDCVENTAERAFTVFKPNFDPCFGMAVSWMNFHKNDNYMWVIFGW